MKKLNVTLIRASVLTAFIALSATPSSADTFTYSSGLFGGFDRPNAGVAHNSLRNSRPFQCADVYGFNRWDIQLYANG